jgi:DNA helicase HerA-like ATPase
MNKDDQKRSIENLPEKIQSRHDLWAGRNYFRIKNFETKYNTIDMTYSLGHSYESIIESFDFPVITRFKLEPLNKQKAERILAGLLSSRHAEMKFHYGKKSHIYEDLKRESSEVEFLSDRVRNQKNSMFYMDLSFRIIGRDPLDLKENAQRFETAMNYLGIVNRRISNLNQRTLRGSFSLKRRKDNPYIIDSRSASSILPIYPTPNPGRGVLVGIDSINEKPVIIDSFQNESFNSVILGETGSGKSFFSKIFLRRSIASGNAQKIFIVDPLNEYSAGMFGPGSVEIILRKGDLLDLSGEGDLDRELISPLASIVSGTIFGDDRMKKEIENDIILFSGENPDEKNSEILHRIWNKYGLNSGGSKTFNVINSKSWMSDDVKVVIFKTNILEEETSESLLPELILSIFAYSVNNPETRKMLVIDEAHLALSNSHASGILSNLSRHSRHYMLSIISITQSLDDLFAHQENRSLLANTASIFVFRTRSMKEEYSKMLNLEGFEEPEFHSLLGGKTVDYSECFLIRRKRLIKLRIISTENERKKAK